MTKIRITGLDKELERTKLRIGNAIARSKFKDDMQELVVEEIRKEGLPQDYAHQQKRIDDTLPGITQPTLLMSKTNRILQSQVSYSMR